MQKEKQLVPKMRFPEFSGVWNNSSLNEITTYVDYRGRAPIKSETGHFLVTAKNIKKGFIDYECSREFVHENNYGKVMSKGLPKLGDVLFTTEAPMGNVAQVNKDNIALAQRVIKFRGNFNLKNSFLLYYMLSNVFQKTINKKAIGTTVQGISGKELHNVKISFPEIPEQQKIAKFLTAIDTRIQTLEKKKSLLEQYKKGVMQKIFKQELRFKDDDGKDFPAWEKKKLKDIAGRVKTKNKIDNQNVLTISAQLGLVSQLDYFNKSVSAKNLKGYYLIERNDFAYNKSYSNGYPMGAIKRLVKYDFGVVSTLYICFRFYDIVSNDFMEQYFDSGLQNREIKKVAQEGARNHGLLNIGINDFFDIGLKLPCLQEQTKIANFLSSIDKKIALTNQQIEHTKTYKRGLLQQMFV